MHRRERYITSFIIASGAFFILGVGMLTQERLMEVLRYDPEIGVFTWVCSPQPKVKTGDVAGYVTTVGYRRIEIDYKLYYASRLAWLYVEGYFPEYEMDHINRIRSDDRWCNLRHVSRQCNLRNRNISKNNTSGVTGVFWNKHDKRWVAKIEITEKLIYLGAFKSKLDAAKARWEAEKKYGYPNCQTTSSAYLFINKCKCWISI